MKKTLRLFLVAVLAMVVGNVMADEVTMAYPGGTTANMSGNNDAALVGLDATKWSVVGSKGSANNYPGLNTAGDIRLYYNASGSNTITVESLEGATINTIKMTFTATSYSNVTVTANGSAVTPNDGEYTINSSSFVLGNGNTSSAQVRIKSIVITYTAGSGDFIVAPAFSVGSGMYFEAQTVALSTTTEGADIFYTTDGTEPDEGATKYTAPIAIPSTTTLKAIAIKGAKSSSIVTATYTIVNTTNKGTVESPFSIADAMAVINVLENKATSSVVYTKGIVVGDVPTPSSGQVTFKIGATADATEENLITVFRAKGLENEAYVAGDTKAGDEVVICAALQNYDGTPETQYGYIYSINGETSTADPVLTGDGSETNPFTAIDLLVMKKSQRPTEAVWVKGIIKGTYKSKTELAAEDGDSNLAISATTDATEFVPVELKSGSDFRTKLNVVDNATNKGKEVLLKGKITDYFSATGVKDLVDAIIDGSSVVTGINDVKVVPADQENAPVFNLAGQKVNANYKGVVIKGGKKMIVK